MWELAIAVVAVCVAVKHGRRYFDKLACEELYEDARVQRLRRLHTGGQMLTGADIEDL